MRLVPFILGFAIILSSCQESRDQKSNWIEPITKMEFIYIPPGNFEMGSSILPDEKTHMVTLNKGFWIGRYEVTRQQWESLMGTTELHPEKPSPYSADDSTYPVVSKSYHDIEEFLKKMNEPAANGHFRLPTEAEWEYACRAGTTTHFNYGDYTSDSLANYDAQFPSNHGPLGKFLKRVQPVGSYPPNQWGLFDMHGNVWEWTSDWYGSYPEHQVVNPTGPEKGELKVMRGGSWTFTADHLRSARRSTHAPDLWGYSIGFRVVREAVNY